MLLRLLRAGANLVNNLIQRAFNPDEYQKIKGGNPTETGQTVLGRAFGRLFGKENKAVKSDTTNQQSPVQKVQVQQAQVQTTQSTHSTPNGTPTHQGGGQHAPSTNLQGARQKLQQTQKRVAEIGTNYRQITTTLQQHRQQYLARRKAIAAKRQGLTAQRGARPSQQRNPVKGTRTVVFPTVPTHEPKGPNSNNGNNHGGQRQSTQTSTAWLMANLPNAPRTEPKNKTIAWQRSTFSATEQKLADKIDQAEVIAEQQMKRAEAKLNETVDQLTQKGNELGGKLKDASSMLGRAAQSRFDGSNDQVKQLIKDTQIEVLESTSLRFGG